MFPLQRRSSRHSKQAVESQRILPRRTLKAIALHLFVFFLLLGLVLLLFKPALDPRAAQPVLQLLPLVALPPGEGGRGVHLKAEDPGLVAALALGRQHVGVHLEEDVVEGGAEVGAVDDGVARRLWVVEVFAAGAVELHGGGVCDVGLAHGEERLGLAHDAGALAEVGLFELLELGGVSLCTHPRRFCGRGKGPWTWHTILASPLVVTT
jgi:hypothetical protein